MSFPPFPPNRPYSPSRAYTERPPFPPPAPLGRDYPTYPYSAPGPAPSAFRPYDPYSAPPDLNRSVYPYEQPRRYDSEHYDPYQPSSNVYDPGAPAMRPYTTYVPPPSTTPAPRRPTPPRSSVPRINPSNDPPELTLLTGPTTYSASGYTAAVHSLPSSHLPLTKLVSLNRDDALELHRHLCSGAQSVWYCDGSSRAGEGWSAAVEWIIDSSRSGQKMRGCVGTADALDAELGGICKAVEGFQELLNQAIKDGKPMSHELLVFCESQAAIASVDTSSRPEAIKYDQLWRKICSEYLHAHMTLVWLPKGTNLEGVVLADKIATVGASNSYLKKKKEGNLPDIYRRPGGGEPAPSGSSEGGPWQRGDADPSKRKSPFDRPKPPELSPPLLPANPTGPYSPEANGLKVDLRPRDEPAEAEEEPLQPRANSVFVTHFPEETSAKDLGILFSQYGNIVAVDIYHISPQHPRFAFVAYSDLPSCEKAIFDLHRKAIDLETPFNKHHRPDLQVWATWAGQLTVVMAEPPRLVPWSVAEEFPDLPDWAGGKDQETDELEKTEVEGTIKEEREATPDDKKRRQSSPPAESSSPNKRLRQEPNGLVDQSSRMLLASLRSTPPPTASLPPIRDAGSQEAATAAQNGILPPTPTTAEHPSAASPTGDTSRERDPRRPLTNSAAEPQEYPIKIGPKTLRAQLNLIRNSFAKVDAGNWIAHACFIASELDHARRVLKDDLYATDSAFLSGRELEKTLAARGFTPQRIDAFINKVLGVLDGIAAAEALDNGDEAGLEMNVDELEKQLTEEMGKYSDQTREAVASGSRLLEYLMRGTEAQERKRLEVERRVKVLEGMVKIGEVVGGVVRFLLTDDGRA